MLKKYPYISIYDILVHETRNYSNYMQLTQSVI